MILFTDTLVTGLALSIYVLLKLNTMIFLVHYEMVHRP